MKNIRCRKNLAALMAAVLTLTAFPFSAASYEAQEDTLEPMLVETEDVFAQAPEEFDVQEPDAAWSDSLVSEPAEELISDADALSDDISPEDAAQAAPDTDAAADEDQLQLIDDADFEEDFSAYDEADPEDEFDELFAEDADFFDELTEENLIFDEMENEPELVEETAEITSELGAPTAPTAAGLSSCLKGLKDGELYTIGNTVYLDASASYTDCYLRESTLEDQYSGHDVDEVIMYIITADNTKITKIPLRQTISGLSGYFYDIYFNLKDCIEKNAVKMYFTVKYDDNTIYESGYFNLRVKGDCGTNATWEYDPITASLIFNAADGKNGKIDDYDYDKPNDRPYLEFLKKAKKAEFKSGITRIGANCLNTHYTEDGYWKNAEALKTVTIANTVTSIGQYAFFQFYGTSITLPDSITTIDANAFQSANLTSVKIPAKMTYIPSGCFGYCTKLTTVTLPSGIWWIGEAAFSNCYSLKSISLPAGLEEIRKYAFYGCWQLENVKFPSSLKKIEESAFSGCGLKTLSLPANVTTIGMSAFEYCALLQSITLPAALTAIGDYAFQACEKLTSVAFGGKEKSIGEGAFTECVSLAAVRIPETVTSIGKMAFAEDTKLKSVFIPSAVKTIGADAFKNCHADLTAAVSQGSVAETYCKANNIKIIYTQLADLEKIILAKTDISNLPEAAFGKLQLRITKVKKSYIKLGWKKVSGAERYTVYGALRTGTFQKLKTVTTNKFTHKGLKKNKYYKYIVVANSGAAGMEQVNAISATIVGSTAGGKYRNTSSVTLNKEAASLKVRKKLKLKGTALSDAAAGKKYKKFTALRFESSKPTVATVTKSGKIKAIKKGTCYIYVYAQDGTFKRIKLKVKK